MISLSSVLKGGIAVLAALAVLAPSARSDERIGSPQTHIGTASLDEVALNACADAFQAKIAPGIPRRVHLLMPAGRKEILSKLRPNMTVEVTMEARSGSQELLARSTCIANSEAKVIHLWTSVRQPANLAQLSSGNVPLALVATL